VLRKIHEILDDPTKAKQLEEETGMSRDELQQFVKKFEQAPKAQPGEGGTIDVKPGENKTLEPRKLDGQLPSATVSSRSQRGPNVVPQDAAGGLSEGLRTAVPAEYQSRYEAYRTSISGRAPRTAVPQR
jgi:hypothetical protein